MEQRRLRLGDILDDYCPRERRVTNHAVVAMIEEDVKQTRCTTCDAEHVYKGGKAPRRKKAETTGVLYKEVLAGLTDPETAAAAEVPTMTDDRELEPEPEPIEVAAEAEEPPPATEEAEEDPEDSQTNFVLDEGPVHRPLIRAQLPRVEGVKVERQAPEFTIRQNAGRGNGSFRGRHQGGGGGGGNNNGQRFGRGPNRGGGGHGFGRGPGGGGPNRHDRGPRKRSR